MDVTSHGDKNTELKEIKKKRPCVTREVQKRRSARTQAWNKFKTHWIKMNNNEVGRVEKLKQLLASYIQKGNKSGATNRMAIADYENKLATNIKQDSKSFYR